ncbi:hypothetical protein Pcinc_036691 [Petrolisthes cinctipes]|uniref:Chitin-binding type-2 domain-containing protein n=1 Tax=Petrolisthes cinctipes TaxID=88211 RepID=A0AAE1BTW5_PETCI|nr:hypothetical protein Pcinc_036691 [Petrolisthes cinctipes]
MLLTTVLLALVACAAARTSARQQLIEEYPSYPVITYCEEDYGLQLYPNPSSCHSFFKCANGTLTEEVCENGLLFDGHGAVHNHCNYHWGVNCEGRAFELAPIARGICEYSFGIYSNGPCEKYYTKCVYGETIDEPCTPGLAYDKRTHSCNWPDLMEYCNPEEVVGFKCPDYIDSKDPAAKFLPFPRFPSGDCGRYIVCVEGHPRLVGCGDYTVFSSDTLSCQDPDYVPSCANYFKK